MKAVSRAICRVHDPADVVPGRICGRHLPCKDHTRQGAKKRVRRKLNLTVTDEVRARLDELAQGDGSRSATVERLVLAAQLPRAYGER